MKSIKLGSRAVFGILIIVIGILFLLNSLGIADTSYIIDTFWPVILIFIGFVILFDSSTSSVFGAVLLLIGIFYQLKEFGILFENVNIWQLIWPMALILVGIWFIVPKRKHIVSIDTLNNSAIFAGGDIINTSSDFKGGEVTAIFGGLDIDLRDADILSQEPVVIDAFTAFGGITFRVPDDWVVDMKGIPLFGGWDNKRRVNKSELPNSKVLSIKCFIIFGGIEIK